MYTFHNNKSLVDECVLTTITLLKDIGDLEYISHCLYGFRNVMEPPAFFELLKKKFLQEASVEDVDEVRNRGKEKGEKGKKR